MGIYGIPRGDRLSNWVLGWFLVLPSKRVARSEQTGWSEMVLFVCVFFVEIDEKTSRKKIF